MASQTQSASADHAKVIFEITKFDKGLQIGRHQIGRLGFQTTLPAFVDDLLRASLVAGGRIASGQYRAMLQEYLRSPGAPRSQRPSSRNQSRLLCELIFHNSSNLTAESRSSQRLF